MKILITHFYRQENRGDAAILYVLLSELKRVFENPKITISTMEDSAQTSIFNTDITTSFLSLALNKKGNRFLDLVNKIYILLASLIWATVYRHTRRNIPLRGRRLPTLLKTFREADIVIAVGGGYLGASRGLAATINLIFVLLPFWICIVLDKSFILHSQSINLFGNLLQKKIVTWTLNKAKLIFLRESISYDHLKKMGVRSEILMKSADAGFLLDSSKDTTWEIITKNKHKYTKIIGITVKARLENKIQINYETELVKFIDYLVNKNYMIVFIPQVTSKLFNDDDRIVASRIINRLKNKRGIIELNKNYSLAEIKSIYSNIDILIGTRFHSVIFSLTSFVPSLAIEYDHKTSGIMNDLHLGEWVININTVNHEALIKMFEDLIKNQKEYKEIIKKNINAYIELARNAADEIKKAYTTL